MNNTLESYPIFPYVAWTIVIGFALFTYTLVLNLEAELDVINVNVEEINVRVDNLELNKNSLKAK